MSERALAPVSYILFDLSNISVEIVVWYLSFLGGRAHFKLFLFSVEVELFFATIMSRHLRVSTDRDKPAKVSSAGSSLPAVTGTPASTRASSVLKSVSSMQTPLLAVSQSGSSYSVPVQLTLSSPPVVSKSVSVPSLLGVERRGDTLLQSSAGRPDDSGTGGPPSESSSGAGSLVGPGTGANVPNQPRTLDTVLV